MVKVIFIEKLYLIKKNNNALILFFSKYKNKIYIKNIMTSTGAVDNTGASILLKIQTILNDPTQSGQIPQSTINSTYEIAALISATGLNAFVNKIALENNMQVLERKVFNTPDESRVDFLLGLKPLSLVPLTGLVISCNTFTISWNSDIEAPILSTSLPSSTYALKLSFYADVESWSLSRVDKLLL